jgi:hypothetical protein
MHDAEELRADEFAFVYLDVDHPAIAWLAYRGIINSCDIPSANPGNLSHFLIDVIQRGLSSTLRREGILEGLRIREFFENVSRLKCVYAWPSLEVAKQACQGRGKFREDNLVAIAPADRNYRRQEYDSNWITDFDSLPPATARKYWNGEQTKSPQIECLLTGRFFILGTAVRQRAYETIKKTNPGSLALLELSRLAVEFSSDLGSSSPWIVREGENITATYVIRYSEEEGVEVFAKALKEKQKNDSFAINWVDIEPLRRPEPSAELDAKFKLLDLTPFARSFRVEKLSELDKFARLVLDGELRF